MLKINVYIHTWIEPEGEQFLYSPDIKPEKLQDLMALTQSWWQKHPSPLMLANQVSQGKKGSEKFENSNQESRMVYWLVEPAGKERHGRGINSVKMVIVPYRLNTSDENKIYESLKNLPVPQQNRPEITRNLVIDVDITPIPFPQKIQSEPQLIFAPSQPNLLQNQSQNKPELQKQNSPYQKILLASGMVALLLLGIGYFLYDDISSDSLQTNHTQNSADNQQPTSQTNHSTPNPQSPSTNPPVNSTPNPQSPSTNPPTNPTPNPQLPSTNPPANSTSNPQLPSTNPPTNLNPANSQPSHNHSTSQPTYTEEEKKALEAIRDECNRASISLDKINEQYQNDKSMQTQTITAQEMNSKIQSAQQTLDKANKSPYQEKLQQIILDIENKIKSMKKTHRELLEKENEEYIIANYQAETIKKELEQFLPRNYCQDFTSYQTADEYFGVEKYLAKNKNNLEQIKARECPLQREISKNLLKINENLTKYEKSAQDCLAELIKQYNEIDQAIESMYAEWKELEKVAIEKMPKMTKMPEDIKKKWDEEMNSSTQSEWTSPVPKELDEYQTITTREKTYDHSKIPIKCIFKSDNLKAKPKSNKRSERKEDYILQGTYTINQTPELANQLEKAWTLHQEFNEKYKDFFVQDHINSQDITDNLIRQEHNKELYQQNQQRKIEKRVSCIPYNNEYFLQTNGEQALPDKSNSVDMWRISLICQDLPLTSTLDIPIMLISYQLQRSLICTYPCLLLLWERKDDKDEEKWTKIDNHLRFIEQRTLSRKFLNTDYEYKIILERKK